LLARHGLNALLGLFDQYGITDGALPYIDVGVLEHMHDLFIDHSDALAKAIQEYVSVHRQDVLAHATYSSSRIGGKSTATVLCVMLWRHVMLVLTAVPFARQCEHKCVC
jgi:hypothetical protein